MSGRRAEVGETAVAEVKAAAQGGAQVRFVQNDVTDEAAVKSLVDGIVAEFGRLALTPKDSEIQAALDVAKLPGEGSPA